MTSMAKPKGAPNPFVVSHASYPGPLGAFAGQVPGHDLRCPLVVKLRHTGRLDRHHRRVGREVGDLGRAQIEELRVHADGGQVGASFAPVAGRLGAGVRAGCSGHRLHGHAAALRPALDLVGRTQGGGGTYRGV